MTNKPKYMVSRLRKFGIIRLIFILFLLFGLISATYLSISSKSLDPRNWAMQPTGDGLGGGNNKPSPDKNDIDKAADQICTKMKAKGKDCWCNQTSCYWNDKVNGQLKSFGMTKYQFVASTLKPNKECEGSKAACASYEKQMQEIDRLNLQKAMKSLQKSFFEYVKQYYQQNQGYWANMPTINNIPFYKLGCGYTSYVNILIFFGIDTTSIDPWAAYQQLSNYDSDSDGFLSYGELGLALETNYPDLNFETSTSSFTNYAKDIISTGGVGLWVYNVVIGGSNVEHFGINTKVNISTGRGGISYTLEDPWFGQMSCRESGPGSSKYSRNFGCFSATGNKITIEVNSKHIISHK